MKHVLVGSVALILGIALTFVAMTSHNKPAKLTKAQAESKSIAGSTQFSGAAGPSGSTQQKTLPTEGAQPGTVGSERQSSPPQPKGEVDSGGKVGVTPSTSHKQSLTLSCRLYKVVDGSDVFTGNTLSARERGSVWRYTLDDSHLKVNKGSQFQPYVLPVKKNSAGVLVADRRKMRDSFGYVTDVHVVIELKTGDATHHYIVRDQQGDLVADKTEFLNCN